MYVRCPQCTVSQWIDGSKMVDAPTFVCGNCGRRREANPSALAKDRREHYRASVAFADASGIDVASANAVLLGIATLQEVEARAAGAEAASSESPRKLPRRSADRETRDEARRELGSRASRLVEEHDIEPDDAREVAVGKLSLRDAIRRRAEILEREARARGSRRERRVVFAGVLFVAILLTGAFLLRATDESLGYEPPVQSWDLSQFDEAMPPSPAILVAIQHESRPPGAR